MARGHMPERTCRERKTVVLPRNRVKYPEAFGFECARVVGGVGKDENP